MLCSICPFISSSRYIDLVRHLGTSYLSQMEQYSPVTEGVEAGSPSSPTGFMSKAIKRARTSRVKGGNKAKFFA